VRYYTRFFTLFCCHTCGACATFIPELIDNGIDILNPVQISADHMAPAALKQQFGSKLAFWGGAIDAQHVLPNGTPDQIRNDVRNHLDAFKPGGGYVFNNVHKGDGEIVREGKIAARRAELDRLVEGLPRPWIAGMEATMFTGWIYDFLRDLGNETKDRVQYSCELGKLPQQRKWT
jgi:hypothetical protein